MTPTETMQWTVKPSQDHAGLQLSEAPISSVGSNDVLIKIQAIPLNQRDLTISNGTYSMATAPGMVAGSDCAGEVLSTGPSVTRFKPGDRVMPIFAQSWTAGPPAMADFASSLGGIIDGVFRQHAVFNEQGPVAVPHHLSYEEAASLPCAAVTAWNALYHGAKPLRVGDTVVTQGTGGVSVFAALFAVRAGARVNGTTSSTGKAEKLKKMGVQHVINYKENPEWGMVVQQLTAGRGAQYVVEVGGPGTLKQSGISAGLNGEIGIVGALGGVGETVGLHEIMCATRRVFVGDRVMFEEMNRAMEVAGIRPVVDGKVFGFEKMREAYWYFEKQGFFGKVVVRVG